MYRVIHNHLKFVMVFMFYAFSFFFNSANAYPQSISRAYYINNSGSDKNRGNKKNPFKTISRMNRVKLHPGDSILLMGGQVFKGTLLVYKLKAGTAQTHIYIFSQGKGKAIINGGNESAVIVNGAEFIHIRNLEIKGSGRKEGNITNGVVVSNCSHVLVDNLSISGFQKAGLLINSSFEIRISKVHAYENGLAGILIEGQKGKKNSKNILITDCLAENNPGDPTVLNNHSGNGILVGNSTGVIIEYCVATNNGWDMPRIGNGPVGIWCYESDSITIQYCISYRNKTSKGGDDGGGFDFDGGVTNSVIQYCLSYENHGSAFGIFQYNGASPWHDNIIRYNISENDGTVSAAQAAAYVWNSSGDEKQFKNLSFYNNILYNEKGAAIHYASGQSKRVGFNFHDNIFVAKDEIIKGKSTGDIFYENTWWSIESGFNADSTKDFKTWALQNAKENNQESISEKNDNPDFKKVFFTTVEDTHKLQSFTNNQLSKYKIVEDKKDLN